jgi:acyl-coenzyme A synthetase/AMP-(fatty) acid ligase
LQETNIEAHCAGNDECLIAVVLNSSDVESATDLLSNLTGLHRKYIDVTVVDAFPKTSSGKIDYASILGG